MKIIGLNQVAYKTKGDWTQTNQILYHSKSAKEIPVFCVHSFKWMKPLWDKTSFPELIIFFLDISQLSRWHVYSLFFRPPKTSFQNISKRSYRNCSNFAIIEAARGGTGSLKRFQGKKHSWYRETLRQVKIVLASLRCYGNSDVNKA